MVGRRSGQVGGDGRGVEGWWRMKVSLECRK